MCKKREKAVLYIDNSEKSPELKNLLRGIGLLDREVKC